MLGKTIRYIPELHRYYMCHDIGCPDFERAEQNRHIVHHRLYTIGYVLVEEAVKHTPLSQPLADWIGQGQLPVAGRKNTNRHSGEESDVFPM